MRSSIDLAHWLREQLSGGIPLAVRAHALNGLVNFAACSLAGVRDPAVRVAADVFERLNGPGPARVLGLRGTWGELQAACLGAMSANVHDFDDTHMPTIAHPTAPVAGALLARIQTQRTPGARLIDVLALGIELECRLARAISPAHYARGWHITSTCGVFGAAAAAGLLADLSAEQLVVSWGAASALSSGLVENLGTMAKGIGVGQAASNGLLAAHLAQHGYTGPSDPLLGARGFLRVYGDTVDEDALCAGLGVHWELMANAFKPYPCGVVLNPVIEACLALRTRCPDVVAHVAQVVLRGHPLLRQRTDRPMVATGNLAQVSAQHAVATALIRGRAGLEEFSDAAVADPMLRAFGERVRFVDDAAMSVDSAEVRLILKDGQTVLCEHVPAAYGGLTRPMSEAQLDDKFRALSTSFQGLIDREALLAGIRSLDRLDDASALMRLAFPEAVGVIDPQRSPL